MARPLTSYKKVLVTGGYGLVGEALQWAVSVDHQDNPALGRLQGEEWVFVGRKDADLRDYTAAYDLFNQHRPDAVIHLAARVGGVFENSLRPAEFLHDNLAIDQNVTRICKELNVKRLVSCLSTCIFPDRVTYPINEAMLHDGPPHGSNYGYAYAKRLLEVTSRAYREQFGCDFVTVIPTNIFGPNDNFGEGCHVVPALIKRVSEAKRTNNPVLVIAGSGSAWRQFIYSRDLAQLLLWTLRMYDGLEPLILAGDSDEEVTIKHVVKLLCDIIGFQGEVAWDRTKTDGQLRKTADNSRMRRLVGPMELTSFEKGLRETVEWFTMNQDRVRGST
ncbi:hypothetical protein K445DRAFT_74766 [Daldinia sp. EC12]|nr:NAD(P)-binding protein [Daldinia eschscholtzii]OTB16286.1 hypothetical protein K445DRAFT_74766 [Daldinia sp. EC12]